MPRLLHCSVILLSLFALSGCATVTITPDATAKIRTAPDYQQRESFYLWGLAPAQREVAVDQLCPAGARQMQAQNTVTDNLLRALTLGFYAPRTVKVWCVEV